MLRIAAFWKLSFIHAGGVMPTHPQSTQKIASPSIDNVVDSQGAPVSDGGFTRDPELTLSGTAVDTQVLEILENGTRRTVVWPEDGTWSAQVRLVIAGNRSFTARSIDTGAQSTPWIISASWNEPVIEGVVDSQGVPVPNGGFTRDPELLLSGASVDTQVMEILDNGTRRLMVWPEDDMWSAQVNLITAGSHSFIARSIDTGAESEPWMINASWNEPRILGVVDSEGVPVPNGGSTPDTLLTLSGTVVDQTRPDVLDILDNDLLTVRAFPFEGVWEAQLRGLTVGGHRFTARSNNNSAVSEPWVITVTTS
ncbi:hypothetical protein ALP94_04166 [Pseudomonas savastanoi pv. glycinea]|nr:hypothetical protein ALP94_04166 [Pseudomonas savastanoi pv. glycinea]